MQHFRNILSIFVVSAIVVTPAFANLWQGTITETITQSDDPLFSVGQTFVGYYEYNSLTIDGCFGTQAYADSHTDAQSGLKGALVSLGQGDIQIDNSIWAPPTHLIVVDGEVTEFYKTGQQGSSDYTFGTSAFAYLLSTRDTRSGFFHIYGTMTFSNPLSDNDSVFSLDAPFADPVPTPDGTPTIAMLGLSIIGLTLTRRIFYGRK